MKKDTSWNEAANWYDELLEGGSGTYQRDVIWPNLKRLLALTPGERVLDLGCGTGFFVREYLKAGARVTGIDNSAEMIALAHKNNPRATALHVASADSIPMVTSGSQDTVTVILALQNMADLSGVLEECARVLTKSGRLVVVLNHPAFRVPGNSSWMWSVDKQVQYRRVDRYLSEAKSKIITHPGKDETTYTVSFHRPLQTYVKALHKHGFAITRLEEWISNRRGPKGKTFAALEQSRKEIPLFLFFEAVRHR